MTDFFISYTGVDRTWAEWIAWQLEAAGYTTIIQAWDILPGMSFVNAMQQAALQAERTIAILSPAYFTSSFTKPEWETAFVQDPTGEKGLLVPVRIQDCDPEGMLARIVAIDLVNLSEEEARVRLLAGVQKTRAKPSKAPIFPSASPHTSNETPQFPGVIAATPLGKLINVPEIPAHFVPRPKDLELVKALVLTEHQQSVAITGVSHRVGLHGMAGIGKSVLAAALTRDDEIREKFPDGVIWLTLGQKPAVIERQRQLATTLSKKPENFTDVQQGRSRLSELLSDTACFIILDDVWQMAHIRAFDGLGSRCCLLITTRDLGLITALGARERRLDVLGESQALELLAHWANQSVASLPDEAHLIMQECDHLPLALAMVGAMVRHNPDRWENVLYRLRHADLDKIRQDFPDYPYPDLLRAIQVSVEALKGEDQKRYRDFAVFQEDTAIAESVLQIFWKSEGLDIYDVQDVVDRLVNRSLLRRDKNRRLTLHDLQLDYVRKQVGDLVAYHNRLLHAYAAKYPEGWHTASDDGYFYTHLAYHLLESDQKEELCSLLTDSPAWMESKLAAFEGHASYLADLDRVLQDFQDPLGPKTLLEVFRLHAAKQNILGQVSSYSDTDLETLVLIGRHSEALNHAQLRNEVGERLTGILQVHNAMSRLGKGNTKLLEEAHELARSISIEYDYSRSEALSSVACAFAQVGKTDQALEIARSIEYDHSRSEALSAVACAFAQVGKTDQALEAARSIKNDTTIYSDELSAVASALTQAGNADQALELTRSIDNDYTRTEVLIAVASALAQAGKKDQALEVAHSIENSSSLDEALDAIASALANTGSTDLALEVARSIENDSYGGPSTLRDIASALAQAGKTEQALKVADDILECSICAEALCAVAISSAKAGSTDQADRLFEKALEKTEPIMDPRGRSEARGAIAMYMAQAGRTEQALEVASSIPVYLGRAETLSAVISALAQEGNTEHAHKAVHLIEDNHGRAEALSAMALALAQAGNKDQAENVLNQALQTARSIDNYFSKARALSAVTLALAQGDRPVEAERACSKALESAFSIENKHMRAEVLGDFTLVLAQAGSTDQALEVARYIKDEYSRAEALSAVASALAQTGKIDQALEVTHSIENETSCAEALSSVASAFARTGNTDKALEVARSTKDDYSRAQALSAVASTFAEVGNTDQALEVAHSIENDCRAEVLSAVASAMAQASSMDQAKRLLNEALDVALSIKNDLGRISALKRVFSSQAQAGSTDQAKRLLNETLQVVRSIEDNDTRHGALRDLAPALAQVGSADQALGVAFSIEYETGRSKALSAIAPHLVQANNTDQTERLFNEAFQVALSIENAPRRISALRDVASAMAQAGLVWRAITILPLRDPDEFVSTISSWSPSLEEVERGLSTSVILEVLRIVGWSNPFWRRVHEMIALPQ